MAIRAVVFDIGETLISDRRFWADWAAWIGVPVETFLPVLGAVVASGRNNADVFDYFVGPGFDLHAEYAKREAAGCGERITETDLYLDVRPALTALREAGVWVGVIGNQTERARRLLLELALPADLVETSGRWGVAKPSPEFYTKVIEVAPGEPHEIVYVGDHPANDVVPAKAAGLHAAHIRRGPWGHLFAATAEARAADWQIGSLGELVDILSTAV